jgi:NADH-quinone oxidoreductase subunit I
MSGGHDDHGHGHGGGAKHDDHGHGGGHGAGHGGGHGHGDHEVDDPRKQSFLEKLYLPEIVKGLGNTFKHMFAKQFTVDYDGTERNNPDKYHIPRPGYRGEHYLKKDDQGHVKCVACFMCAAACPAECIHIEGAPTPPDWKDRERYPKRFEIDLLRCIYCGYCEEACPVDAIALSSTYNVVSETREEKVYVKDRLLDDGEKYGLSKSHHHYRPDGVPGALPAPKAHGH